VNLGNYEHFELEAIISDDNEEEAMERATALMQKAYISLGIADKVTVKKP
jgi:hypothetical protein